MRIIMLGAPGVGKGSQATRIAGALSIPHVSTGDLFREQITGNTDIGKKASSFIAKGMLVPDEITVDILAARITKDDCRNGFILDGFPRTVQQAQSLDNMLSKMNICIDAVVNISLDDSEITRRIVGRRICASCGAIYHIEDYPPQNESLCNFCSGELISREDDTPNVIKRRLLIYHDQTKPLIKYYRDKIKIVHIVSEQSIEVTTQKVFEALDISVN